MVIYCAVGGRTSLLGALYGAVLVGWARTSFSEAAPQAWLFAMGSLFIVIVVAFPNGLAGIYRSRLDPLLDRVLPQLRMGSRKRTPTIASVEAPHAATVAE